MKKFILTLFTVMLTGSISVVAQTLPDEKTDTTSVDVEIEQTTATDSSRADFEALDEEILFIGQPIVPAAPATAAQARLDTTASAMLRPKMSKGNRPVIYSLPYSVTGRSENWHRMWINTAVLSGAFVSTLLVLECLPEDATSWNRAELQKDPPQKRWFNNVFKRGPEWDHDNLIFNYVLHPYAGAVYFMAARSCGFSYWGSLLYATAISTVGWEFGIEACMERPSIQDIFVTPIIGSLFGEAFYHLKRHIVNHDYTLWGSRLLGNVVVFLIDPVNEVIDLFRGSETRKLCSARKNYGITSSFTPVIGKGSFSIALTCVF